MTSPYERATALIAAEHEIVNVVFNYIDRMNDACFSDPLEVIAEEFIEAVNPVIDKHLKTVGQ